MPKNRDRKSATNGWDALKDVLIASMAKGQFPLALVVLIVLVIIVKMPSADVSRLAFEVLEDIQNWNIAWFVMWLLTVGGWFAHARWQRRRGHSELHRVSRERTMLQEKLTGRTLESSEA